MILKKVLGRAFYKSKKYPLAITLTKPRPELIKENQNKYAGAKSRMEGSKSSLSHFQTLHEKSSNVKDDSGIQDKIQAVQHQYAEAVSDLSALEKKIQHGKSRLAESKKNITKLKSVIGQINWLIKQWQTRGFLKNRMQNTKFYLNR